MTILFVADITLLSAYVEPQHMSAEEFLLELEDQLEQGLITMDDAIVLIQDFNRR